MVLISKVDRCVPKSRSIVVRTFPDISDQGIETVRALRRKGHSNVTMLVLDVDSPLLADVGCRIVNVQSVAGTWAYWRARVVVHTHGVLGSLPAAKSKRFVNIWHGMPVKRLDANSDVGNNQTDLTVATSDLHAGHLAETWGLSLDKVLVTGLPRNDLLVGRTEIPASLRQLTGGRPLVVWLPTYRTAVTGDVRSDGRDTGTVTQFDGADLETINQMMGQLGVHCLIKPHPLAAQSRKMEMEHLTVLSTEHLEGDLGCTLYEVLAQADVLITDHSSVWIDFLLTQRPIIFTISDLEEYSAGRGYYFTDLAALLPGPIAVDTDQLAHYLKGALVDPDPWVEKRRTALPVHHAYIDSGSADRVADVVIGQLSRSQV